MSDKTNYLDCGDDYLNCGDDYLNCDDDAVIQPPISQPPLYPDPYIPPYQPPRKDNWLAELFYKLIALFNRLFSGRR